jgi:hypothetical protein
MKKAANRLPASRCFSAVSSASPTVIVIVRSAARPSISSVELSAQWASPVNAPSSYWTVPSSVSPRARWYSGPEPSISMRAPRQAERGLMT